MIRVLLADDHAIVRMGLRAVLDSEEDITIVGEADTADDAVRAVENAGPDIDVVLMDLRFGPGQSGRELETGASATARIRELPDPPNVLVVTNYDTDVDILGAIEAGAVGYLALLDLECVDPVLQLAGVDQRPQDVVVEVPEP